MKRSNGYNPSSHDLTNERDVAVRYVRQHYLQLFAGDSASAYSAKTVPCRKTGAEWSRRDQPRQLRLLEEPDSYSQAIIR